nr:hypothetical protein CFP56_21168 [Quercus suber]
MSEQGCGSRRPLGAQRCLKAAMLTSGQDTMMSGFPRFSDFRPLDGVFTCSHPCRIDKANPNRRCALYHRSEGIRVGDIDEVARNWLSELVEQLQVSPIVAPPSPPVPRFLARPVTRQESLQYVFSLCLGEQETGNGTRYMVKRAEDQGLLKIGITHRVANDKFAYFESVCGFVSLPLRQIRRFPCVR